MSVGRYFVGLGILGSVASASFFVLSARAQDEAEEYVNNQQAFADYDAHVAANDAAALRSKAGNAAPLDAVANQGCPEGTQFWRRDEATEVCAPLCASDADCAPEDGRCRILDVADDSSVIGTLLVDDIPPEEHESWMEGVDPERPPVMLCDPFWDVEGVSDMPMID